MLYDFRRHAIREEFQGDFFGFLIIAACVVGASLQLEFAHYRSQRSDFRELKRIIPIRGKLLAIDIQLDISDHDIVGDNRLQQHAFAFINLAFAGCGIDRKIKIGFQAYRWLHALGVVGHEVDDLNTRTTIGDECKAIVNRYGHGVTRSRNHRQIGFVSILLRGRKRISEIINIHLSLRSVELRIYRHAEATASGGHVLPAELTIRVAAHQHRRLGIGNIKFLKARNVCRNNLLVDIG